MNRLKKLTPRAVVALTNAFLLLVVAVIGAVCFFPTVAPAAGIETRVHYRGRSENGISPMFNVYWGTEEVRSILDILDEYEVKVTFFIGGSWADDNAPLVKEIAARGHEIGTHGYFHKDQDKLSYEDNYREIRTSAEFLARASGREITLFAPPSGAYSENTVNAADALRMQTVLWSRDTIDWRDKDEDICYRRATEHAEAGDLVLMHPMAHTVKALPRILATYKEKGLNVITVSENIGE